MELLTGGFMSKLNQQQAGFTVLELVIVLASIAILAALIAWFK